MYDRGSCLPSPCPSDLQFPGGNGSASVWVPTGIDPDKADWYGSLIWDQQDATGYQYKRNRYYDPGTGRFTQEDPIGLAGGMNLYGFAGGDPINFGDPFGLATCPPVCGDVFSDLARRLAPLENPLNAVGEVSGVNDVGRAGDDIAGGHPIRGGISIAMALPGIGAEGRLGVKLTRWGWSGQQKYRAAVRLIGTEAKTAITHLDVFGKVPTQAEALELIEQARGLVNRIEEAHLPGGVSTHTFPHINYTTRGGTKATVRITEVVQP